MEQRKSGKKGPSAAKQRKDKAALDREARLRSVLKQVHQLLQSYAPTWYTEALDKKIQRALTDN